MTKQPPLETLKAELIDGPVVYLIHFAEPFSHARHYVGSTSDLTERLRIYREGLADSSRLMLAIHQAEIPWTVVRVWQFETMTEARSFEYRFKKSGRGNRTYLTSRMCPRCRPAAMAANAARMRALRERRRQQAAAA